MARAVGVAADPPHDAEDLTTLLKGLINFIVGTIAGVLGNMLFGPFGAILGFIAGGLAAWWVVRKMDFF